MKMYLATQRLHKCNITDIQHVAAKSMTALKFLPHSCINIDVHNSIKTFCSECFKAVCSDTLCRRLKMSASQLVLQVTAFFIPRYTV